MFVPRFLTGTTGTGTAFRQSQMAEAKSFLYQAPQRHIDKLTGWSVPSTLQGTLRTHRSIPPNAMKNIEGKIPKNVWSFACFFVNLCQTL